MRSNHKKINKAGGLTIPAGLRRDLGINSGDAVDLVIDGGNVVVKPHVEKCLFCNSDKGVLVFNNKRVCTSCIKELGGMIHE